LGELGSVPVAALPKGVDNLFNVAFWHFSAVLPARAHVRS